MRAAIILIILGLLFMGVGLPIAEWERGEVFEHELRAEQVTESEEMDLDQQVNWSDLSTEEQDAVLRSYNCDCKVTMTTDEPLTETTSELDFNDDHWTLVNADGAYLLVGTTAPEPRRTTTQINWAGYLLAAIGLVMAAVGAVLEARDRERIDEHHGTH